MSEQEKNYSSYAHDDLDPAKKMRIERTIYFESDKADISTLTALPLAELLQLRQESEAAEQSIYAKLQEQAYAWEQQAGNTRFIEKAIEYVKTPEVSHTSNEWKDEQYDRHVISNRVYKMQYHIYENTRYDPVKKKAYPIRGTYHGVCARTIRTGTIKEKLQDRTEKYLPIRRLWKNI